MTFEPTDEIMQADDWAPFSASSIFYKYFQSLGETMQADDWAPLPVSETRLFETSELGLYMHDRINHKKTPNFIQSMHNTVEQVLNSNEKENKIKIKDINYFALIQNNTFSLITTNIINGNYIDELENLQHIILSLKPGGKAAVIVSDHALNIKGENNQGAKIRAELMNKCDLHTIFRLPAGSFGAQNIKANILFFERGASVNVSDESNTSNVWFYDMRTNMSPFGNDIPLTQEDLQLFQKVYFEQPRAEQEANNRWRCFSREAIAKRGDNLDIVWLYDTQRLKKNRLSENPAVYRVVNKQSTSIEDELQKVEKQDKNYQLELPVGLPIKVDEYKGYPYNIPIREVWALEAVNFTPWLNENLDIFYDLLGLEVNMSLTEENVGSLRADMILWDIANNCIVVENQLEKSDHDHLGKIITYIFNKDAKIGVWITSEIRPEHLLAVQKLNKYIEEKIYIVKLGAIRIADSPPIARFELIPSH